MTTHLIIADTAIRQDAEGRYCLNDLHRAAGGERKHQPFNFMRLDTTVALVSEIQSSDVRTAYQTINGGQNRGTYVCKELVYAYAMWISPAFHLKVIRAYDSLVTAPSDMVMVSGTDIRSLLHSQARLMQSQARLMEMLVPTIDRLTQPVADATRDKRAAPMPLLDEEKDQLIRLLAKGLSQNAIAREMGRSPACISKYAAIVRVK